MYKLAFWWGRIIGDVKRGYRDGQAMRVETVRLADAMVRVQSLVDGGCYVQAIKEHRSAFGTTLAEAKNAVDAMQHSHGGGAEREKA